jgi:hypothetical protein
MTRMVGTGKAPQGYMKDQVFDVPEHDQGTVEDLERKGWAKRLDPRDDVGHSKVSVANAVVRGDMISHPVDKEIADEIGGHDAALAIVHTSDPDATSSGYEQEAEAGHRDWDGNPVERAEYGHVVAAAQPQEKAAKKASSSSSSSKKPAAAKADEKADDDKAKK